MAETTRTPAAGDERIAELQQQVARLEDEVAALTAEIRESTSRLAEQLGDNLRPEVSA